MLLRSRPYLNLINRLRTTAINSDDLLKRDRMREDMLGIISRAFNVSSSYICQHDFHNQVSIVRHHYNRTYIENVQLESDFDQIYHEYEMGQFVAWLHEDSDYPLLRYVSEMEVGVERDAYEQYGVETVVFVSLYYQDSMWGYLEIWDPHRHRKYSDNDLSMLVLLASYISDTILTVAG